jgi:flagellar biosynthesis/type III secretory pathway protein FliH
MIIKKKQLSLPEPLLQPEPDDHFVDHEHPVQSIQDPLTETIETDFYSQQEGVSHEELPIVEDVIYSPYEVQPLGPQLFEEGVLPDRRKIDRLTDRRQDFRRLGDEELISRAELEANAIRERAAQEGLEQGLLQANEVVDQLYEALSSLYTAQEQALENAARQLVPLAVEIAEKIIQTEVRCDEELVLSMAQHVIKKVGRDQRHLILKVNPTDYDLVNNTIRTAARVPESTEIRVYDDESVEAGSVMIETRAGQIDARFSTQLAILKRMLILEGG